MCINQDDKEEEKHQIPLMKYIYARATCVIIWLGLSDEFTADALLLIDRAAKLLREETRQHFPRPRHLVRETAKDEKNKKRELPTVQRAREVEATPGALVAAMVRPRVGLPGVGHGELCHRRSGIVRA